jgi:uncharacterized protein YijF (DUF1287 family)
MKISFYYPIKDLIRFVCVDVKHRRNISDKIDFDRRLRETLKRKFRFYINPDFFYYFQLDH